MVAVRSNLFPLIQRVVNCVGCAFGVSPKEIQGKGRPAAVAEARHAAIHILINECECDQQGIIAFFGIERTLVPYAIARVNERLSIPMEKKFRLNYQCALARVKALDESIPDETQVGINSIEECLEGIGKMIDDARKDVGLDQMDAAKRRVLTAMQLMAATMFRLGEITIVSETQKEAKQELSLGGLR